MKSSNDRPLSSKKSFGIAPTFARARKDKLVQYSSEYDKEFKNKLGPGPAAYFNFEMSSEDLF